MTTAYINEDTVEQGALDLLRDKLGYATASGPDIAPDGDSPERNSYQQVILEGRLRSSLTRINPQLPPEAIDQVIRRVAAPDNAAASGEQPNIPPLPEQRRGHRVPG